MSGWPKVARLRYNCSVGGLLSSKRCLLVPLPADNPCPCLSHHLYTGNQIKLAPMSINPGLRCGASPFDFPFPPIHPLLHTRPQSVLSRPLACSCVPTLSHSFWSLLPIVPTELRVLLLYLSFSRYRPRTVYDDTRCSSPPDTAMSHLVLRLSLPRPSDRRSSSVVAVLQARRA